eukprot:2554102-Karenia_brevis.AAC.1
MCSGTDSPVLVYRAFTEAIKTLWGKDMQFDHLWSAEIKREKQEFIKTMFCDDKDPHAVKKIFSDMTVLHTGKGDDVLSESYEDVDDGDLLFNGFACPDVSRKNPNRAESASTVRDADKRTGATLAGGKQFIWKNRK